jgi:hypothetical protein
VKRGLILAGLVVLACASGTTRVVPLATDLDLVARAAGSCIDSVVAACRPLEGLGFRVDLTGGGDGAWLVRSQLERALLEQGFPLRETGGDSTTHVINVRIAELGVRHRQVDRKGIAMTPWVLRDGSCVLAARVLSPSGAVVASVRTNGSAREWTRGADLGRLSDPVFSPSTAVPTTPGLVAPLAVAGVVGTLLALFFVTSE